MIYIYTLSDPTTNMVRYVGKTNNIKKRLILHMSTIEKYKSHKNSWLKFLKAKSLKPIIEIIDVVNEENWGFWEQYWISQFKTWGFNLTNSTDGGDSGPSWLGKKHTEKSKLLMSSKKKNYYPDGSHPLKNIPKSIHVISKLKQRARLINQINDKDRIVKVWGDVNQLSEFLNIRRDSIYGYIKRNSFIGDFRYEFINNTYYNDSSNYKNKGS